MNNYRIKKYKKGAALVEFAIMTTVMVPLLLYISFFSELIQFRMKIDEMKYFAAWELAAHQLSDYKATDTRGAYENAGTKFTSIKTKIETKTKELYANLDSADPDRTIGYIMLTPDVSSFTLTMNPVERDGKDDDSDTDTPSSSGGGMLGKILDKIDKFIGSGINYVAGKAFGFNIKYIGIEAQASGGFNISKKMNTKIMTKDNGGFTNGQLLQSELASGNLATYTSPKFRVWVDTWAVDDGSDAINVNPDREICISDGGSFKSSCQLGNPNNPAYTRQVQRMSLLGTTNAIGGDIARLLFQAFGSGGLKYLDEISGLFGATQFESPSDARMVSKNYYYDLPSMYRGNYTNNISKGQTEFQTSPLVHRFRDYRYGVDDGITDYQRTLENRRNFYMGNNEPNCNYDGSSEKCTP